MSKAHRNWMRPVSELNDGQIIVRIKGLRELCDDYQSKIALILAEGRGGCPTSQLLVRMRARKAALEKDIRSLRRRLSCKVNDARDTD